MKKVAFFIFLSAGFPAAVMAQNIKPQGANIDTIVPHAAKDFIGGKPWVSLSAGVVIDGRINLYNFGSVGKDKVQPPSNQTIYEIGSISKTFASVILAHAVLEKRVKLDDDIRKYLNDGYPNLQYGSEPIRLLHLVNLTSRVPDNLPDNQDIFKNTSADSALFAIAKLHNGYTKQDLLRDLHNAKLDTVPGIMPRHSNVAGQLLGYILENIYHKPYDELVKAYITGPLKMTNTFMTMPVDKAGQFVQGYNVSGRPMPNIPDDAKAAGGMHSSIEDLTRYMKYHLEEKDPAVKMTHQPIWGNPGYYALGMNWFINKTGDGKLMVHDDGTTLAFTTYFMMYPELNFGVVLTTNFYSNSSNDQLGELASKIFNEYYYTPAQIASDGFGFSASINKLLHELNSRGYNHAIEVADELKKADAKFNLDENEVNNWAYKLSFKGKKDKAMEIFKLNVSLYPNSYNVYDSIGELYEALGNKELAIKNYKRSLELNPDNTHGTERLKQLR